VSESPPVRQPDDELAALPDRFQLVLVSGEKLPSSPRLFHTEARGMKARYPPPR